MIVEKVRTFYEANRATLKDITTRAVAVVALGGAVAGGVDLGVRTVHAFEEWQNHPAGAELFHQTVDYRNIITGIAPVGSASSPEPLHSLGSVPPLVPGQVQS